LYFPGQTCFLIVKFAHYLNKMSIHFHSVNFQVSWNKELLRWSFVQSLVWEAFYGWEKLLYLPILSAAVYYLTREQLSNLKRFNRKGLACVFPWWRVELRRGPILTSFRFDCIVSFQGVYDILAVKLNILIYCICIVKIIHRCKAFSAQDCLHTRFDTSL
jgi:hypothetical protein